MKPYPAFIVDVPSLDVRRLSREGWLRPGLKGEWVWRGRRVRGNGEISLYAFPTALRVSYRIRGDTGFTPVSQTIPLDCSVNHHGGKRVWFRCPCCTKRIAIVYMTGHGFRCRTCSALVYRSQYPSHGHSYGRAHRVFHSGLYNQHVNPEEVRKWYRHLEKFAALHRAIDPRQPPEIIG